MASTLAQLTNAKTVAQVRQQLLDGLAGRGVVTKVGTGTGSLSIAGTPSASYLVKALIAAGGELGAATVQLSTDGGATYGAAQTIPASGIVALVGTSVTLTFAAGSTAPSFVAGDAFSFSLTAPFAPVGAWQAGSLPRTLVELDAQAIADLTQLVASIAQGGLVTTQPGVTGASGAWLDLVASSVYSLTRQPAVAAVVSVALTDAANAGPFTIAAGQLWVATSSGLRFTNVGAFTLPKGGAVTVPFQAESPGAAWNTGDSSITVLQTSLPGVTVANPGPASFTTSGVDTESDTALATRCIGRWASLGTGSPAAAYDSWARSADATVTRTKVSANGSNAMQVDLYLAGAAGGVPGGVVTNVVNAIAGTSGPPAIPSKMPIGATLNCLSATGTAVTITATVNAFTAYLAAAQAACEAALAALIQATPIGGTLYLSQIIDAFQRQTGVRNVTVSAPAADVALTATQVATLAGTRTYNGI